jgi:hypothetical protein
LKGVISLDVDEKKKYVLLVERLDEHMAAVDVKIIAKFGNTKKELHDWANAKYPKFKHIILNNTPELADFFYLSSAWSMDIRKSTDSHP